jgi:hypothetical protein
LRKFLDNMKAFEEKIKSDALKNAYICWREWKCLQKTLIFAYGNENAYKKRLYLFTRLEITFAFAY